jgi:hypothetical protein
MLKKPTYYVDTSVFGGCLDAEFSKESIQLFDACRAGTCRLIVTPILLAELSLAPAEVLAILEGLPRDAIEAVPLTREAEQLRDEYLTDRVVGPKWRDDAHHVALATVSKADLIVSWNFKHLVNIGRIRGFNAVNLRCGYQPIDIRSPKEVLADDDEDV